MPRGLEYGGDSPVVNAGIGMPVLRKEDSRLLTGGGRFSDDVNLPGQAYAAMVRSPHAHARIAGIDAAQALAAPGVYKVAWAPSPRLKRNTYRLIDVPERSGVLIHSANYMGDRTIGLKCQSLGCIALGEKRGTMDGQAALLLSFPAVRRFEQYLDGQPFELEVADA